MLTEDQANVASDALMSDSQQKQRKITNKLDEAREQRRMPPVKWLITGAIVGSVIGGVLGYLITGTTTAWSIAGLALGTSLGIMLDSRGGT